MKDNPGLSFLLMLAEHLGKTLQELLTGRPGLAPNELELWQAHWHEQPWGSDWYRDALLCTVVANSAGPKKPCKPADFMPRVSSTTQTNEQLHTKWKSIIGLFGGTRK